MTVGVDTPSPRGTKRGPMSRALGVSTDQNQTVESQTKTSRFVSLLVFYEREASYH